MHNPVLLKEVVAYLEPKANDCFIDCTFNGGGHGLEIINRISPKGILIGIEWDGELIEKAKNDFKDFIKERRLYLVKGNYAAVLERWRSRSLKNLVIKGILFDLGMSSWHIDDSGKGFSFRKNEPLDMRYSTSKKVMTAAEVVNSYPQDKLEKIIRDYGEDKFARGISQSIVAGRASRRIETTKDLVDIIARAVPRKLLHKRIHFATRTFQALRIFVNGEIDNIERGLKGALKVLRPGGKLAIITFHSLEDRLVKNFLKQNKTKLDIITKKPTVPDRQELIINPRARSAKLRVAKLK